MFRANKTILFIFLLITISSHPIIALAGNLAIGAECSSDSDCASGECENADNDKAYCTCDDNSECPFTLERGPGEVWECSNGAEKTYDINYCVSNKGRVDYAIPPKKDTSLTGKIKDTILDPTSEYQSTVSEINKMLSAPQTQINIPGLNFTPPKVVAGNTFQENGDTYLSIPYLAEYISAIYRYIIVVSAILGIVVILFAGFGWMISGGSSEKISESKKKIGGAIMGLLIALLSYTLLYTVNPKLVELDDLKIRYVEGKSLPLYSESETYEVKGTDPVLLGGKNISADDKCLMDTFHLEIGKNAPKSQIKMFGIRNVNVNTYSLNAWQKVSDEVLASNDPEVKGYIQYMKDFNDLKLRDLSGTLAKGGATGAAIQDGMYAVVGISRHNGTTLKHLTYDMHVNGLALDIMALENWDINWENGPKGKAAGPYCNIYKQNFEKMKKEFPNDPYKMYARLEKNIKDCFNKFDNGNNPFTTMPKEFINIFERNGFYWGGWGWGHKLRSDAMHFEYMGPCGKQKTGATPPADQSQVFNPGQCDPNSQSCN